MASDRPMPSQCRQIAEELQPGLRKQEFTWQKLPIPCPEIFVDDVTFDFRLSVSVSASVSGRFRARYAQTWAQKPVPPEQISTDLPQSDSMTPIETGEEGRD